MLIYFLLALHFVSDFLLQSREIAERKSENFGYMFIHCLAIFFVFAGILGAVYHNGILFAFVYSLIHFLQDTFVWRTYKWYIKKSWGSWIREFKYWEESSFYSTIGLDQMLHVTTLIFLQGLFL